MPSGLALAFVLSCSPPLPLFAAASSSSCLPACLLACLLALLPACSPVRLSARLPSCLLACLLACLPGAALRGVAAPLGISAGVLVQ